MTSDLTAGLDPMFEHFMTRRPDNPAMRDAAVMWVFDDSGQFALPRFSMTGFPALPTAFKRANACMLRDPT